MNSTKPSHANVDWRTAAAAAAAILLGIALAGMGCDRATTTTPTPAPQVAGANGAAPASVPAQAPGGEAAPLPEIPAGLDAVRMTIGKQTFVLEIADSPDEHERGLMYRESMPADHGMIFVFNDASPRAFWMKNTLIPLDIIYLDSLGRVLAVKPMQPKDLRGVGSDGPAMFAIELNQGAAAKAGVQRGDAVEIPAEILNRQRR